MEETLKLGPQIEPLQESTVHGLVGGHPLGPFPRLLLPSPNPHIAGPCTSLTRSSQD